ncbi:MAG: ATP-binding cassette domain-containing protein [Burkholderiales bacterium]
MNSTAIEIDALRCEAPDGRVTLEVPSLSIANGERVAVIGPNGAGKSTLLRCLTGFAIPARGKLRVLGRSVEPRMAAQELRQLRCEVAQVLQGLHLVQRLSAEENVLIGALGRLRGWRSWARFHTRTDLALAAQALEAVGLGHKADERCDRLSGGERQRVAVARMLMQQPQLILADEPTSSLDPAAAADVCRLLREGSRGATLVSVVHQAELLPQLAERVIGLRQGRIVFDGPVAALSPGMLGDLYEAEAQAQGAAPARQIDAGPTARVAPGPLFSGLVQTKGAP